MRWYWTTAAALSVGAIPLRGPRVSAPLAIAAPLVVVQPRTSVVISIGVAAAPLTTASTTSATSAHPNTCAAPLTTTQVDSAIAISPYAIAAPLTALQVTGYTPTPGGSLVLWGRLRSTWSDMSLDADVTDDRLKCDVESMVLTVTILED